MKRPGDLLHDAHYAFAFRTIEPAPERPRRLLVLLHGVGGDELQLASLGARVSGETLVALPRGPRSISGGKLGWFRVGLSEDGPEVVDDEAEDARIRLGGFLGQLQHRHGVPPSDTVVAGFSQGGVLAAAIALTEPGRLSRFALCSGRLMPELEGRLGPPDALHALDALVVHGRQDEVLPVDWAHRADAWLSRLGVAHRLRLHDAGHTLTPAMEQDLLDWLERPAAGAWGPPAPGNGAARV